MVFEISSSLLSAVPCSEVKCCSLDCGLTDCHSLQAILNDPFLGKRVEEGNFSSVPLRDEFLENARLFIFETYCRIHRRIDMGYVCGDGMYNVVPCEGIAISLWLLEIVCMAMDIDYSSYFFYFLVFLLILPLFGSSCVEHTLGIIGK